ncbi:MAG: hypothetical protein ACI9JM_001543 [Halioglobus sp.]|jgi:hypothetical protein
MGAKLSLQVPVLVTVPVTGQTAVLIIVLLQRVAIQHALPMKLLYHDNRLIIESATIKTTLSPAFSDHSTANGIKQTMDLLPTEEQQQIIDSAAIFLANEFPVDAELAAGTTTTRISPDQLQQIAELGWLGIGLPDEMDGIGYGLPEEALLFVELGRNLMPPSLLASVLAARIASQCGNRDIALSILEGKQKVAIAIPKQNSAAHIGATTNGDFLVYEAQEAHLILVAGEQGAALLPLDALELITQERCIDPTLGLSTYHAANSPVVCFVDAGTDQIFLRGALLTSALLLGIAEATQERAVNYAKEREQFGKAIGSFQAIKHYCADMSIRCESIRAMLYHASITLAEDGSSGLFDAHTLKALANAAARDNAHAAVQIHGGMGFTQEMDIHLFVKRAQILGTLFGSERLHLKKLLHAQTPD